EGARGGVRSAGRAPGPARVAGTEAAHVRRICDASVAARRRDVAPCRPRRAIRPVEPTRMFLRPFTRCLSVLALLLAAATPAAAQLVPLDGLWFRLDVHAPGRTLNTDNLKFKKASVS